MNDDQPHKAAYEVALPRGLDDLSALMGQQHDIRFNCRTSYHVPAAADLSLVCDACAAKWWAVTATMGEVVAAVLDGK